MLLKRDTCGSHRQCGRHDYERGALGHRGWIELEDSVRLGATACVPTQHYEPAVGLAAGYVRVNVGQCAAVEGPLVRCKVVVLNGVDVVAHL